MYVLRAIFLELMGCDVFEDLSAVCWFGTFDVPW